MKVLWLARAIPLPLDAGDRIYTAYLSQSVAEACERLAFVGLDVEYGEERGKLSKAIDWRPVPSKPRSPIHFLFSKLPMSAARSKTRRYRNVLRQILRNEQWDVIVLDHYAMVWCLDEIGRSGFPGVVAHVAHDFETKVLDAIAANFRGNAFKKQLLRMNARRTKIAEERLASTCHIISAITQGEAHDFASIASGADCITLSPGFKAARLVERDITEETSRRVVMLGSFQWLAKQMNLQQFLLIADHALAEAGIELCVIGVVPDQLKRSILKEVRATKLLGFVDDPAPIMADSRISVIFEETGGGFKLKMLDYIFNRLPLFSLEAALAGLPPEVMSHTARFQTSQELVQGIIDGIDDVARLNAMQNGAIAAAQSSFDWKDRGELFIARSKKQLEQLRAARS